MPKTDANEQLLHDSQAQIISANQHRTCDRLDAASTQAHGLHCQSTGGCQKNPHGKLLSDSCTASYESLPLFIFYMHAVCSTKHKQVLGHFRTWAQVRQVGRHRRGMGHRGSLAYYPVLDRSALIYLHACSSGCPCSVQQVHRVWDDAWHQQAQGRLPILARKPYAIPADVQYKKQSRRPCRGHEAFPDAGSVLGAGLWNGCGSDLFAGEGFTGGGHRAD